MDSYAIYKSKAVNFLKENKIQEITLEKLVEIIKQQGYQVVLYNTFENNKATETLLEELDLVEYSKSNRAFTFVHGNIRIVFLDNSLLDKDKLYALLHEEGHIYCGHMDRYNCSATNVEDELEANEFAHYVSKPPIDYRLGIFISCNKILLAIILLIIILGCVGPIIGVNIYKSQLSKDNYVKTMDYYVTETGNKYHLEGCRFLKGAKGIRKITEEEFKDGIYDPCKYCIGY